MENKVKNGQNSERLNILAVSDSKIKEIITEYLYKYMRKVDYETRSNYDIVDAIDDGLDDAIKEMRKL